MDIESIVSRLRPEHAALLTEFAGSVDFRRLPPHTQPLVWSAALLETMEHMEMGWADVDLYALRGMLYGAMSWLIDAPPEDPAAVARELDGLIRHVARTEVIADARGCCEYLITDRAAADIAAWVAPMESGLPPSPRIACGG
jgi:hypothetical protein